MSHESLMAEILQCDACRLRQTRNNAVLYRGALDAIMLVGEAPGLQEDLSGQPFVGPSGCLLNNHGKGGDGGLDCDPRADERAA